MTNSSKELRSIHALMVAKPDHSVNLVVMYRCGTPAPQQTNITNTEYRCMHLHKY